MVGGGCQRAPTTGLQRKRKVSRKEKQKWAGRGLCPRSGGPQNRHAGSVGPPSPYLVFRARWQTPALILRPLTPFAAPTVLGPAGQHCRWYECIDAGPHRVRGCMRGRLMCLPRGCMGRARELTKHHVSLDTCDVTWLRARPIGGIQKQTITTCAEPLNEHNGSYRRQRGYGRGGVPACAYNGFTTETESFAERETEMGWTRAMPAKRGSTKPARRFCGPSKPISRLSRTMADSCADSEPGSSYRPHQSFRET